MVKTRKQEQADLVAVAQEKEEEYDDEDTIHVYVPQQSSSQKTDKKRSRHDDHSEEEEMTPAKKRKSLPVRAKDEDEVQLGKTRPVVEIISKRVMSPVRNSAEDSESEDEGEGEEGEDEEGEDEEDEDEEDENEEDEDEEDNNEDILNIHPADGKVEQSMENLADPDQTVYKNKRRFGGERQVVPSSDPADNESELEDQEEPTPEKLGSKKHKRFGSEDAAEFLSTAPEAILIEDEEENSEDSDDSDDEAPEAVMTETAAQIAKLKQREAANAIQEQLSASRKKRKEREATIKKQQDKKRRKEDRIAQREAARATKSEIEADIPIETQESDLVMPSIDSSGPLPNLLPLEYLEDDDDDVAAPQLLLDEPTRVVSKKTRFRDLIEKAPKDKRVGRTTYRVVKASNNALAPRAAYNARKTKESWLAGMRRGSSGKLVGGGERKVMNKGFLKR